MCIISSGRNYLGIKSALASNMPAAWRSGELKTDFLLHFSHNDKHSKSPKPQLYFPKT